MEDSNERDPRVRYDVSDRMGTITLCRPEARNAVDPAMSRAVAAAVVELEQDPAARVGILTGQGAVFCAGADLKAIAAGGLQEIVQQPGGFCGLGDWKR